MAGLLMTRPIDAAQRFVSTLPVALTTGMQVIYAPLIKVQPLHQCINLDGVSAVIFTSAHGVSAAAGSLDGCDLRAYCLGQRTTLSAQNAGWQAEQCGMTADELVTNLLQQKPRGMLLHLRGRHTRGHVAARISAAGLNCREQVIYDQPLLPLTKQALSALSSSTDLVVPLFSPRTARQFADLCPMDAAIHLIAMSDAVADPLKSLKYKDLRICSEPEARAMMQHVRQVAEQLARVESSRLAQ